MVSYYVLLQIVKKKKKNLSNEFKLKLVTIYYLVVVSVVKIL